MAEEMPHPKRDLPKAILIQITLGFLCKFILDADVCFEYFLTRIDRCLVLLRGPGVRYCKFCCRKLALLGGQGGYGTNTNLQTDFDALLNGVNSYPLAIIYAQATADADGNVNKGAVFGLLFIILCSGYCCVLGTFLTNSRTYWALARDNAVPLSGIFGKVNKRLSCPVNATLFCGVIATGILAIPLGSNAGFLAITGSFIVLTSVSYGKSSLEVTDSTIARS